MRTTRAWRWRKGSCASTASPRSPARSSATWAPSRSRPRTSTRRKGYQLNDRVGVAGVEQTYEERAAGQARLHQVRRRRPQPRARRGRAGRARARQRRAARPSTSSCSCTPSRSCRPASSRPARHEVTVTGTDLKPQSTGQTFSAPAGAAVVQDPNTGEVLAMASYPTFDNRWFVNNISDAKMQQLFPAERSPLVNRAISGQYAIGSTMKLFTSIAALQSGQLNDGNYVYDDKGTYEIPDCLDSRVGCVFKNSGGLKPGKIDLTNALSMSSDDVLLPARRGACGRTRRRSTCSRTRSASSGSASRPASTCPTSSPGRVPTAEVKKQLAEREGDLAGRRRRLLRRRQPAAGHRRWPVRRQPAAARQRLLDVRQRRRPPPAPGRRRRAGAGRAHLVARPWSTCPRPSPPSSSAPSSRTTSTSRRTGSPTSPAA